MFAPEITDDSLRYLKSLTNLRSLNLSVCYQLTDAGLEHLHHLDKLLSLDISDAEEVTEEGIMALKQALPNCDVNYR